MKIKAVIWKHPEIDKPQARSRKRRLKITSARNESEIIILDSTVIKV